MVDTFDSLPITKQFANATTNGGLSLSERTVGDQPWIDFEIDNANVPADTDFTTLMGFDASGDLKKITKANLRTALGLAYPPIPFMIGGELAEALTVGNAAKTQLILEAPAGFTWKISGIKITNADENFGTTGTSTIKVSNYPHDEQTDPSAGAQTASIAYNANASALVSASITLQAARKIYLWPTSAANHRNVQGLIYIEVV